MSSSAAEKTGSFAGGISKRITLHIVLLLVAVLLIVSSDPISDYAYSKDGFLVESLVEKLRLAGREVYYRGGVAAEHPRCSEIGVQMMELGGNAVDAAIAGSLCIGGVHNFAAGIGGFFQYFQLTV